MVTAANEVHEQYVSQEKTPRQNQNWITMKQIKRFFAELKAVAEDHDVWTKERWTMKDRQMAQDVMVLAFHGGSEAPLRLELATLRWVNVSLLVAWLPASLPFYLTLSSLEDLLGYSSIF